MIMAQIHGVWGGDLSKLAQSTLPQSTLPPTPLPIVIYLLLGGVIAIRQQSRPLGYKSGTSGPFHSFSGHRDNFSGRRDKFSGHRDKFSGHRDNFSGHRDKFSGQSGQIWKSSQGLVGVPVELADVFKNGPMSQEKWPNVPRNCPQCPEIDICPNGPEVS